MHRSVILTAKTQNLEQIHIFSGDQEIHEFPGVDIHVHATPGVQAA